MNKSSNRLKFMMMLDQDCLGRVEFINDLNHCRTCAEGKTFIFVFINTGMYLPIYELSSNRRAEVHDEDIMFFY